MRNASLNGMLEACSQAAAKSADAQITARTAWMQDMLAGEHKPTLALVSFNSNHAECLEIVEHSCGIGIPRELRDAMEGSQACLILDHSEAPSLLLDEEGGRSAELGWIRFGVPSEYLKDRRLVVCDGIQSYGEWLDLSGEIDTVCLVVNATMAMNQTERVWMQKCLKPLFSDKHFAIEITMMDKLNTKSEADDVRGAVTNALKQLDITAKILETPLDALDWMQEDLSQRDVRAEHEKRVLRNGLAAVCGRMQELSEAARLDAGAVQSAVAQLEKQKKNLELAGKLASESVVFNAVSALKFQASESIQAYNQSMVESIRKKVEHTPLDQLESLEDKVKEYVSGAWGHFLGTMTDQVNKEMEKLYFKLTKQMEADAGTLISALDEAARRAIYEALELDDAFYADRAVSGTLADVPVRDITENLRRETRNMMLLSIPLFFANPLVSIGTIFVSKYAENFRLNHQLSDIQSQMMRHVEQFCHENAQALDEKVQAAFDESMRTGEQNVMAAYNGLVERLEHELRRLEQKQDAAREQSDYLKLQSEEVFPAFLQSLEETVQQAGTD